MPQVYKGGTDQNDKNTAMPDKKGSALNKLKDDKFYNSELKMSDEDIKKVLNKFDKLLNYFPFLPSLSAFNSLH